MGKKIKGPTEIWTRIAGFKVQSANHYTMGPALTKQMNFRYKYLQAKYFWRRRWKFAGASQNTSCLSSFERFWDERRVKNNTKLFLFHVPSLTISWLIRRQISMVFACQQDSFLRKLKTKVVSCKAGKLAGEDAFELILEDTVLFPEGGGQVGELLYL